MSETSSSLFSTVKSPGGVLLNRWHTDFIERVPFAKELIFPTQLGDGASVTLMRYGTRPGANGRPRVVEIEGRSEAEVAVAKFDWRGDGGHFIFSSGKTRRSLKRGVSIEARIAEDSRERKVECEIIHFKHPKRSVRFHLRAPVGKLSGDEPVQVIIDIDEQRFEGEIVPRSNQVPKVLAHLRDHLHRRPLVDRADESFLNLLVVEVFEREMGEGITPFTARSVGNQMPVVSPLFWKCVVATVIAAVVCGIICGLVTRLMCWEGSAG